MNEQQQKEYEKYVKEVTPVHSLPKNMIKAFLVGGTICLMGEIILNITGNVMHMDDQTSSAWCSIVLVGCSVLLTGLNIYPRLAKFGGAGTLVPITGFANSVAAPAIEYQKEGQVFGIGAKIFTIAGPVILYGIFTSWILGLVYWIMKCMGVA